jgi:hypothetical protein
VRAEHDEANVVIVGRLDDPTPGRRSLDRHASGSEACRLGQRGSLRGGLLGRGLTSSDAAASIRSSRGGRNPTLNGCHLVTTSASRSWFSWPAASAIAVLASSEPS